VAAKVIQRGNLWKPWLAYSAEAAYSPAVTWRLAIFGAAHENDGPTWHRYNRHRGGCGKRNVTDDVA